MNPFSVVSHIQSNLPSLSTSLLQRRKSAAVNVVVQTSPATKTTSSSSRTPPPLPPHAPTTTATTNTTPIIVEQPEEDQTEQAPASTVASKPRNNPQAILEDFPAADESEIEPNVVEFSTDLGSKDLIRHSIHIMPDSSFSTPPVAAVEKDLQRVALHRHNSFPTVHKTLSTNNGLLPERASLDGFDRAKVLLPSPSDPVQATTMISQPRPPHLRHTRSSSLPHSLVAPAHSPRSPATVPTPQSPALLPNIPAVGPSMNKGDDESEEDESSEDDDDGSEEHPAGLDQSSLPRSHITAAPAATAPADLSATLGKTKGKETTLLTPPVSPNLNAASTNTAAITTAAKASVIVVPVAVSVPAPAPVPTPIVIVPALPSPPTSSPPSPSLKKAMSTPTPAPIVVVPNQSTPSIPPSSPIHYVTYVSSSTSSSTATTPSSSPSLSPVSTKTTPSTPGAPSPVSTAAAAPPAASSTTSSFLSAWQGRSRAMIPTIPRPSPLMPFHAARKVVSSVTTRGSGLLPTKEQLNSIPVAGRILSHPVMDSTLSYIAEKASERGIDLHALTGGIDPKKLIRPEDVPYRKLNKTMIQQAMTLSVLAVQKEELSKAMDDEAGDDAFELYLAAVNTLLHSLPFETCDPLRREALETQLRSFIDDHLSQKDDGYLSETGSTSKKLRRRRRRRHRQHHDQATSLIHQHTQETTTEPTTSQGHQRRQQIRQKNLQREQRIKQQQLLLQQQAMEKQQQQEQKEKRRQDKKIAAAMAAAAASQKQSGKASSPPATQDRTACKKHKRSSHSRRRHAASHHHQHPDAYNDQNGSGLGDAIISTAVHSAIRLKQSPIPDVVKSCLRTSKTIFHKVDERFHLQDKAWELSKNSIEKAIELDEQYAIHEAVTETVFATLTGLVKAGIAYKETPSYASVRAAADNGKIAAAPPVQVLESSSSSSRPLHPQGTQPSSRRKGESKSKEAKKAAAALKEKEKAAAAAAAAAKSSITSRWSRRPQSVVVEDQASSDSEEDSDESDSDSDSDSETEERTSASSSLSSSSSAFSSTSSGSASSSSCSSTAGSGAESDSDSDNETIELNNETLRPSAVGGRGGRGGYHHGDTSKLPPPPPYSEQVREKIDMFMALKGAASLLVVAAAAPVVTQRQTQQALTVITPSTNSLIIKNPNVINHYVANPNCWREGETYGTILAIDVGNAYTTAAFHDKEGNLTIVRNEYGRTKTPSTIAFIDKDDPNAARGSYKVLIGDDAEAQRANNPTNTIHDWQRFTFQPLDNEIFAAKIQNLPYKVVRLPVATPLMMKLPPYEWCERSATSRQHPESQVMVQVNLQGGRERDEDKERPLFFSPEKLTALMVRRMKELAESQLGAEITHAVVVVPGEYNLDSRLAIRDAVERATAGEGGGGLTVLTVRGRHQTPLAAYKVLDGWYDEKIVVVVDVEEGMLEVASMEMESGIFDRMGTVEERGVRFDEEAVDRAVVEYLVEEYLKQGAWGSEAEILLGRQMIMEDERAVGRLIKEMVKVKELFSGSVLSPLASESRSTSASPHSVRIEIESFHNGQDLSTTLDLSTYHELRKSTLSTILPAVERVLKKSEVENKNQVDHVFVTGSSPRVPEVIQLLEGFFEGRIKVPRTIDPALVVVRGSARHAREWEREMQCLLA
ncbi:hypothetical protein BGX33_001055 [Mortierella sp. NVP41]|nr:hypothetical protein BGX33_001055 [Mortierella sp. NVP41]